MSKRFWHLFCVLCASVAWTQSVPAPNPAIHGHGTPNFVPVFNGKTLIGDSQIIHSASESGLGWLNLVGIGTIPNGTLDINVGPHRNAFKLGDFFAGSFLIRDTAEGFIDIQTFNSDLVLQCCTDNGNILMFPASNGHLGIGSFEATNIITVKQGSDTDPIADAWTTYSSRRWKTNIQSLDGALDKVLRLRPVVFDWKTTGKHDLGLIAEEVGQVIPEIVAYEQNGQDAKSIDYGRLTALLVEAIKQQQKEIQELKARIETLEPQTRDKRTLASAGKN